MTRAISFVDRAYAAYARVPRHRGQVRALSLASVLLRERRVLARTEFGVMRLDVDDAVQIKILEQGAYEPLTVEAVRRLLKAGQCFVDVGAHVGQFALLASALVGRAGRVIAIEPNPETFCDLQTNLALNACSNVTPVSCAVTSDARIIRFASTQPGNRAAAREVETAAESQLLVGAFNLSTILTAAGVATCDVLKIDVEGNEWRVLEPFFANVSNPPGHIIFEFLPEYFSYHVGPQLMLERIANLGYRLTTVEGRDYRVGDAVPEHNLWAQRQ